MVAERNPNLAMVRLAVDKLKPLLDDIALIGGCATGLLITDPGAAPVRGTKDVDIIIEISTYAKFTEFEARLRALGFRECPDDNVICRWCADDLVVDVMPTDTTILGFGNRWYEPALKNAQRLDIGTATVRVITAPYFLATKIEAFHGRGNEDYLGSHDMEDIVTVIDGRPELVDEVRAAEPELAAYLAEQFTGLVKDPEFVDSIPGHLMSDDASQGRREQIIERVQSLASIKLL